MVTEVVPPRPESREMRRHPGRAAFSPAEVATVFGVSRSSIYEAIRRGELRSVRLGGRRLIPVAEIRRVLASGD